MKITTTANDRLFRTARLYCRHDPAWKKSHMVSSFIVQVSHPISAYHHELWSFQDRPKYLHVRFQPLRPWYLLNHLTMLIRDYKIYSTLWCREEGSWLSQTLLLSTLFYPSGHYTLHRFPKRQDASSTRLQILLYFCIVYRRLSILTISQFPSKIIFHIFHLIPLLTTYLSSPLFLPPYTSY